MTSTPRFLRPAPGLPASDMDVPRVEWPTIALVALCYGLWAAGTLAAPAASQTLAVAVTAVALVLHSSLQHEIIHGHPTRHGVLNEALVFPAAGLFIPFRRFRDTHLAHHDDSRLTDPYDDPESNFLAPDQWAGMGPVARGLWRANNTLLGRMAFGPVLGLGRFYRAELTLIIRNAPGVRRAWALHAAGLVPVALWLAGPATMELPAYLAASILALSILRIRTFLEHRAHPDPRARSVLVEDRGPLALLFLNNNLHALHHARPGLPWYRLPAVYTRDRAGLLAANGGYRYRSYCEIFARHLLHAKDPVAHPLYPASPTPAKETSLPLAGPPPAE